MKSHKSFFAKMVLLAGVFLSTQSFMPVEAQDLMASNSAVSKIQFVGMEGNMLVFDLHLSNLPAKGSWIRLTDDDKNILFEQRIHSTMYSKRYKIVRENIQGLHFEVINKETLLKESFRLKYKVEEKMEVVKA